MLFSSFAASGQQLVERRITAEGARQIQVVLAEKASRTPAQRKIDSGLLLESRRARRATLDPVLAGLRPADLQRGAYGVLVDLRADVGPELIQAIEELGGRVVHSIPRYRSVRAEVPLAAVEVLAARAAVQSIVPARRAFTRRAINTSEGDVAHEADTARAFESVTGAGISVGVLSDSVDELATLQGSGDLPSVVTVLAGQSGVPGTSEGTAMLEIVHDLAPGADLLFATAFGGLAVFAQNIADLVTAGADVIVDDVGYFAEGVFQDDIVAAAVDAAAAQGVLYFSSAGNSGNLNDGTSGVYEADFDSAPNLPAIVGAGGTGDLHDFDSGAPVQVGNQITKDSPSVFTLKWADALGASGNDYDLVLMDNTLTTIFAVSNSVQDGDDEPFELISSVGFNDLGNRLVVLRRPSQSAVFLRVNSWGGELNVATSGQTGGHNTAHGAFGVAAVDVATASGGAFIGGVANPVEPFSSDGPRRVFFDASGTPYSPGNFSSTGGELRDKPDIAAADGVMTATPGFNPFFGTSASAPHAAAIAALMLEKNPGLTPAAVRAIFAATALDIEAVGMDRDSGYGLIMADDVLAATPPALIFADGFESGNLLAWN